MKLSLIALATLLSTSAFALQVGDSATYAVSTSGGSYVTSMTVTQISGDEFTAQATATVNGQTQTQEATGSISELAQMDVAYANCSAAGGSLENVSVGAQSISTCHLSADGQDLYVSPAVTFGMVKSVMIQNGVQVTIALTSFRKQ